MGTYVYALFGHSGDAGKIATILQEAVRVEKWEFRPDSNGTPEPTAECIRGRWSTPGIWNSVILDSKGFLLKIYARGAAMYHSEVRYWAFASDGRMDNGLGRKEVRERSLAMARRFGSDRILYVSDRTGFDRLQDGLGIEEEEKDLQKCGPSAAWDHQVTDAATYMGFWFRESVTP